MQTIPFTNEYDVLHNELEVFYNHLSSEMRELLCIAHMLDNRYFCDLVYIQPRDCESHAYHRTL